MLPLPRIDGGSPADDRLAVENPGIESRVRLAEHKKLAYRPTTSFLDCLYLPFYPIRMANPDLAVPHWLLLVPGPAQASSQKTSFCAYYAADKTLDTAARLERPLGSPSPSPKPGPVALFAEGMEAIPDNRRCRVPGSAPSALARSAPGFGDMQGIIKVKKKKKA